jgi:hypothetical protein
MGVGAGDDPVEGQRIDEGEDVVARLARVVTSDKGRRLIT